MISSCNVCSSDDLPPPTSPPATISSGFLLVVLCDLSAKSLVSPFCSGSCAIRGKALVSLINEILDEANIEASKLELEAALWVEDNYASASDALLAGMTAGAVFLSFIHSELYLCFGKSSPTTFNFKITEWLLSFLRAISGKLNKNTISQLVKTCDIRFMLSEYLSSSDDLKSLRIDDIVLFPLYVEAIRFAFHEESMGKIKFYFVATLTRFHLPLPMLYAEEIFSAPHVDYFSNLISFFRKQSIDFNKLVSDTLTKPGPDSTSTIIAVVDDIEDNLYYFSDIRPLHRVLRGKFNGYISGDGFTSKTEVSENDNLNSYDPRCSMVNAPYVSSSSGFHLAHARSQNDYSSSNLSLRRLMQRISEGGTLIVN
ncbi:hypothetical protein Ahy_B01g054419 [Arachis hypogaea]|uniref:Uncharacterized protein n=1 Tax=Arachis hypogaea TaxID=3818 RepID=A0A445ATV6_ARAHY|nr:hypothetical protein Ahy_B01g054419 [Arachis hypogaea]